MAKRRLNTTLAAVFLAASTATTLAVTGPMATPALGHDYTADGLKIDHPWARPTPGNLRVTAAYMSLENSGGKADTLTAAKTDIAGRVELHESLIKDGKAIMRLMPDGISVPAGGTVELKPKGLHIMVMGLKKPLAVGDSFPMTLTFAERGDVDVEVKIETGVGGKDDHSGHDHSNHGDHSGHKDHSGHGGDHKH